MDSDDLMEEIDLDEKEQNKGNDDEKNNIEKLRPTSLLRTIQNSFKIPSLNVQINSFNVNTFKDHKRRSIHKIRELGLKTIGNNNNTESVINPEAEERIHTFITNENRLKSMLATVLRQRTSNSDYLYIRKQTAQKFQEIFPLQNTENNELVETIECQASMHLNEDTGESFSKTEEITKNNIEKPINDMLSVSYKEGKSLINRRKEVLTDLAAHKYNLNKLQKKINANKNSDIERDFQKFKNKVVADENNLVTATKDMILRLISLERETEKLLEDALHIALTMQLVIAKEYSERLFTSVNLLKPGKYSETSTLSISSLSKKWLGSKGKGSAQDKDEGKENDNKEAKKKKTVSTIQDVDELRENKIREYIAKDTSNLLIVSRDYMPQENGELTLYKGDTILCLREVTKSKTMAYGLCNGCEGRFPLSHTKRPDVFI